MRNSNSSNALTGLAFASLLCVGAAMSARADDHRVLAAGSLRLPVAEILQLHAAQTGIEFEAVYGPSGKLRELIEQGEPFSLFLSASRRHTNALLKQGKVTGSKPFTRNALCLMVAPGRSVAAGEVVDVMLDSSVRLGTSTPKADPSGDYTWEMFRKIDAQRPGAYDSLDRKALKLTGGALDRNRKASPYADVFREDKADVFVSYCTNAVATAAAVAGLTYVRIPEEINVAAEYGMGTAVGADGGSRALAELILGPEGRSILEKYGFR